MSTCLTCGALAVVENEYNELESRMRNVGTTLEHDGSTIMRLLHSHESGNSGNNQGIQSLATSRNNEVETLYWQ